ncbi:MAG: DUF4349 domain-containing protein [Candidatus Geothermarchaeales archaeon]
MQRIKPTRRTLLLVAAFVLGIIVAGFILGFMFYTGMPTYTARWEGKAPPPMPAPIPTPAPTPIPAGTVELGVPLEIAGRMVIYNAWLDIEVEDVDSATSQIQGIAEGVGGFVSQMSFSREKERRIGSVTIRVPQRDFYTVIHRVEQIGEVKERNVKSQDVTEQYVDLEARLRNAQRQEERLLLILEKAVEVKDILEVERELMRTRETIERLTGQMRFLERRVEYATITVALTEPSPPEPLVQLPEVDWGAGIEAGLWGLFLIVQGLMALVIVLTPVAAVGVPIYYLYKRRRGKIGVSKKEEHG